MRIILASASPRRRELLRQIGLEYEVFVSDAEEKVTSTEPGRVVEGLAEQKAECVYRTHFEETQEELFIIAADTIVACEGRILGKPRDAKEAAEMLRGLQGRAHEVYTGVNFLYCKDGRVQQHTFHEATKVHFYPMSDEEIAEYVASKDPMDKAGAYGIQGLCARYIKGIEGDYNNVVGLPVGRLYQEMKNFLKQM